MGNNRAEELYQKWVKQNRSEEGSESYNSKQMQTFAAYCIKSTNEDVGIYKQALEFIASDLFGHGAKSGVKAHEIARKVLSPGAEKNAQ